MSFKFLDPTPVRALVRTLLVLSALWVIIGWVQNSGPLVLTSQASGASRDHLLTPPAQRLGGTSLVFHRSCTSFEKAILREQLRPQDQLVEYSATWPEFAGYALVVLCLGAFLGLAYNWLTQPYEKVLSDRTLPLRLNLLAALCLSYWLATVLGWVWLSAPPFLAAGASFAFLSERIRRDMVAVT